MKFHSIAIEKPVHAGAPEECDNKDICRGLGMDSRYDGDKLFALFLPVPEGN